MVETKTIAEVAKEMYNNLDWSKRSNGEKFVKCINTIEWQQDIIHRAHGDRLPNDDMYERIYDILSMLRECESEEDAQGRIYEIEADIYTFDLTKWLHDHIENVCYLTEVLEEYGSNIRNGFELLTVAQLKYIQEIGNALLSGIQEYIERT